MQVIIELIDVIEKKMAKTERGEKALEQLYSPKTMAKIEKFEKAIELYKKNYQEYHAKPK